MDNKNYLKFLVKKLKRISEEKRELALGINCQELEFEEIEDLKKDLTLQEEKIINYINKSEKKWQ